MRIFVDGVVFEHHWHRGIRRYCAELLARVGLVHEVDIWLERAAAGELPKNCTARNSYPRSWRPGLFPRMRRRLKRPALHRVWSRYQLYVPTFFTPPPLPSMPMALTVHDMIVERFPGLGIRGAEEQARAKQEAIRAARICIAVSQATADEVVAYYPEAAPKIRTVHSGADHLLALPASLDRQMPTKTPDWPYALFIGDRGAYKNFRLIVEAMAEPAWPKELRVVAVGPAPTFTEELSLRGLGVHDRVLHVGQVSDAELSDLYRGATGTVIPSLAEGFGFPALEAQAYECPVICSDIAVFREVLGDSAQFFDPRRAESLAGALSAVLDAETAQRRRAAGRANVRRFQWSRCAELTMAAYEEAQA